MREQPVKHIVDATATQQRYIIHLTCGHNLSLFEKDLRATPHLSDQLATATHWQCPYCPDPVPDKAEQEPTAQQLWREAGEP